MKTYSVALSKGAEQYAITFTEANRSQACRQLGRWASNRELSFSWYDAALMASGIRKLLGKVRVAE